MCVSILLRKLLSYQNEKSESFFEPNLYVPARADHLDDIKVAFASRVVYAAVVFFKKECIYLAAAAAALLSLVNSSLSSTRLYTCAVLEQLNTFIEHSLGSCGYGPTQLSIFVGEVKCSVPLSTLL